MISEFYKKRTIYENGFDFTMYMFEEMERAELKRCKSPVFAGIRVTSVCNMKCPHCFAKAENMVMSLEQFKYISTILLENEIYKLTLTGGEPFTNPELMHMIKFSKSRGFKISLHTNGSLLNKEKILLLAGILEKEDWIQVSFDGFDVDSYKLARNSDCFQQICQNIKTMVAEDINVKLNVVVTNKNYKMLDKIYAKAQELGVDKISFMPLMGSVDPRDEVYFPSDESVFYEMTKVIKMFMSGNNSVIIDIDGVAVPWGCTLLKKYVPQSGELVCPAGKTSFEIDVNGDVYPCPFLFDTKYLMGNLFTDSMESIWTNKSVDELVSGMWSTEEMCQECEDYKLCKGGCYAMAKHSNRDCDIRCDKVRRKYKDAAFKECIR